MTSALEPQPEEPAAKESAEAQTGVWLQTPLPLCIACYPYIEGACLCRFAQTLPRHWSISPHLIGIMSGLLPIMSLTAEY